MLPVLADSSSEDGARSGFTYELLVSCMAPSSRKTSVAASKAPSAAVELGSEKLHVVLLPSLAVQVDHEVIKPGVEAMAVIKRIEDVAPVSNGASAGKLLAQRFLYVVCSIKPVGLIRSYALASADERQLWARSVSVQCPALCPTHVRRGSIVVSMWNYSGVRSSSRLLPLHRSPARHLLSHAAGVGGSPAGQGRRCAAACRLRAAALSARCS